MKTDPREGLINSFMTAEIDGDRLTEDEIVANCIVTMVGGQETTTNLIGNGILSLLRNPDQWQRLKNDLTLIPSAVEELLRYESPSQHTARICPEDTELGGRQIRKGQAVIAVMGAGNRDPERFPAPDQLDLGRADNRHLAFGWASHFCFGAALARIEGQLTLEAIAARTRNLTLEPGPIVWRQNLGLRGLTSLPKSRYGALKLKSKLWRMIYRFYDNLGRALPRALRDVQECNWLAAHNYVPQLYDGRVTLFWASSDLRASFDLVAGWRVIAGGGIEVHEIPGTHLNIIKEPHVAELALKLSESLARAQGRHLRVTKPEPPVVLSQAKSFFSASSEHVRKVS
jgi:hypothetical protein